MKICHCLFYYKNNKIIAVLLKSTGMEVIKFGGENHIEYCNNFWNEWIDYAGCTSNTLLDFCIIYDKELPMPKDLESRKCTSDSSIWSRNKIQETIEKFVDIMVPTEIRGEDGELLFKAGSFRNVEKEIFIMTAKYKNANDDTKEIEDYSTEMTPFIRNMVDKLNDYDKIHNI
jgi:hypothetical protein